MEIIPVYFRGGSLPLRPRAKVPAYPLCGGSTPATPPNFCRTILVEFSLLIFLCLKQYIIPCSARPIGSDGLPRICSASRPGLRVPTRLSWFPIAPALTKTKASRGWFFAAHFRGFCARCLRTSGPPLHKLCRQNPCIGPNIRSRFR
jgi:hypothetical protein